MTSRQGTGKKSVKFFTVCFNPQQQKLCCSNPRKILNVVIFAKFVRLKKRIVQVLHRKRYVYRFLLWWNRTEIHENGNRKNPQFQYSSLCSTRTYSERTVFSRILWQSSLQEELEVLGSTSTVYPVKCLVVHLSDGIAQVIKNFMTWDGLGVFGEVTAEFLSLAYATYEYK